MSIKKIAEMTGASASTVARVLRDPDHKCSSELMKQKILSAAREIGYVPNEAAKLLKSGKNTVENVRRIYILLPRITSAEGDPFYTEMLRQEPVFSLLCFLHISIVRETDFCKTSSCCGILFTVCCN